MQECRGPTLTFDQLQVLASRNRLHLLLLLRAGPATTSELAVRAKTAKSTAHAHLQLLQQAGFVVRERDQHKWVYYTLTPLGAEIVAHDPMRLAVDL